MLVARYCLFWLNFLPHAPTVCVDNCNSDWYSILSGVPQGSVLGPLLFNVYTSDLLQIISNPIYGYADDVTFVANVDAPKPCLDVSASLNENLRRISDWCRTWNVKLDASKSKCLCISRFRMLNPPHGPLLVDGAPLTVCDELDILGIRFDSKLTWVAPQCSTSLSLTKLSPPLGSCVVAKQHGILVTDAMSAVSACYIRSMPTSFTHWMLPSQMHTCPPGTLDLHQIHTRCLQQDRCNVMQGRGKNWY